LIVRQVGIPNYLAAVVESVRETAGAAQRSDVDHSALIPEVGILSGHARRTGRAVVHVWSRIDIGLPGNLAPLVDRERHRVGAAQSADIPHEAVLHEESPCLRPPAKH